MATEEVKQLAYKIDPECWISYSGMPKAVKQYRDGRRSLSLQQAEKQIMMNTINRFLEPNKCKRCLLGIDDDGDGDCAICAHMCSTTAERVKRAVERLMA